MNDFRPTIKYASSNTGQLSLPPPRKVKPEICDTEYTGEEVCTFEAHVKYCLNNDCKYSTCAAKIEGKTQSCQRKAAYDVVTSPDTIVVPTYCLQHAKMYLNQFISNAKPAVPVVPKRDVSVVETWIRENGHTELFNNFQARLRLSDNPI